MSNVSAHSMLRTFFLQMIALAALGLSSSTWSSECSGDKPWLSPAARSAGYADADLMAFYELSKQTSAAYARRDATTRSLASRYLDMARRFPCDWNYGNAIHNANSTLGLLALHDGRKQDALLFLRAAGKTPGSPQLDSFGPSLLLATELARAGEFKEVSSYLASVRRFWKAEDLSPIGLLIPYFKDPDPLATWIEELDAGRVPNFGAPFNSKAP